MYSLLTAYYLLPTTYYLLRYDSDVATETKGSMALHGAQVTAMTQGKAGGFWILSSSRSLEMQADIVSSV